MNYKTVQANRAAYKFFTTLLAERLDRQNDPVIIAEILEHRDILDERFSDFIVENLTKGDRNHANSD